MGASPEGTDESLFAAYVAGDVSAHEALFRRYQEPLCRHFERILGNRAAAEDVVIETFLRLHRHRRRFRTGNKSRLFYGLRRLRALLRDLAPDGGLR
jgi:Sigma-70 region 2